MNKFLRPETLFSNKFESYLNEWQEEYIPLAKRSKKDEYFPETYEEYQELYEKYKGTPKAKELFPYGV